jgi:hypothetical protein
MYTVLLVATLSIYAPLVSKMLNSLFIFLSLWQCYGSGIRCFFDPWISDPGWVKKSGSGSGMNNPDHISERLEKFFEYKYLNSLMRIRHGKNSGPGSGNGKIRIRDSEINIPDPQLCSMDNERCVAEEVLAKNIDYRQQVIRDLLEKEQEFVSDLRHHVPFIN